MATVPRMTHYRVNVLDEKAACGRDGAYIQTVTADRPMYHPTSKRLMRAGERRAVVLKSVTCKRCRKLAGAA